MWSDEIFFSYSTAQKLYIDIETCKRERKLTIELDKLTEEKINNLLLDKETLLKESSEYKAAYLNESEARIKAEQSKPSRITWFLTGAMTVVVSFLGVSLSQ